MESRFASIEASVQSLTERVERLEDAHRRIERQVELVYLQGQTAAAHVGELRKLMEETHMMVSRLVFLKGAGK